MIRILLTVALFATPALAQVPCWTTDLGTSLGLVDESVSAGQPLGFTFNYGGAAYTDIQVCSNGYVTLGPTGGVSNFTPSPNPLVNDPFPRICPFWVDLNPGPAPGGGDVFFNAIPQNGSIPAHAVVTWVDVPEFLGVTPHTFQLVLIDGDAIRCSYDANISANSNPWLVGASPGSGAAQNVVSFATLPLLTAGNPTLHEEDPIGGPGSFAGTTLDWTPDGSGGFTVTEITGCAVSEKFGSGCVGEFTSFYEWFQSTPSIDLSNSAMRLTLTGNTYVVSSSPATYIAPTAAVSLNLSDDSESAVPLASALPYPGGSTTLLNVCSNGHVSTASNGAAGDFSPTPGEFLGWNNATWAVWRDLIPGPGGGGSVKFEETGNLSIVTWDAVIGYVGQIPGTTPSTFQIQFDRSTGQVDFVFVSLDTTSVSTWAGGDGWIVGFTVGGQSLDPGSIDLSNTLATGSFTTASADLAPLTLDSAAPVIGATIDFHISNIPANAIFGGVLLGFVRHDPGIDLTAFGMPGCYQYNDQASAILFFPGGATTIATPFSIPNYPGAVVIVQSAAYDPMAGLTPLGAISSNGLELTFGQ